MEREKRLLKEAPEEFHKQICQEITKLVERLSEAEMGVLERMCKDRRYARREGRENLAAEGEVTRTAGSGSQNLELEAARLSAEVTPAKSEDDKSVLPMDGAVDRSQNRKRSEEVTVGNDAPSTEVEGGFVMCEIGGEQQPVRVKAPPQKRRVVARAESAETQDHVSGQQGLEELGQEETEELGFYPPNAVGEPQWLCTCATRHAEKRASSSSNLRPL